MPAKERAGRRPVAQLRGGQGGDSCCERVALAGAELRLPTRAVGPFEPRVRPRDVAGLHRWDIVSDLLTGPLLLRAVLPAVGPMDDTLLTATVGAALNACESAR